MGDFQGFGEHHRDRLTRVGDLGGAKGNHGIRSGTALGEIFDLADVAADRLVGENVKHARQSACGFEIEGSDSSFGDPA